MSVIDHLDNYRVAVTAEDIEEGVKRNQFNCAIVRAIQRQEPDAVNVRVNTSKIRWSDPVKDVRVSFDTPPEAVEKIIKPFDRDEGPQPASIQLKGGTVRDRDHNSEARRRRERQRQRETPGAVKKARGSEQLKTRKRKSGEFILGRCAEYLRYAPDK